MSAKKLREKPSVQESARVADVMTQVVVTVAPETPIQEAIDLFASRHISGAPVVSSEGDVLGVVSTTDVLRAKSSPREGEHGAFYLDDDLTDAAPSAPGGDDRTVLDIATRRVVSIDENAPLPKAAQLLLQLGIRRLLVSRNGKFAGILSATDVLKWVAEPALQEE